MRRLALVACLLAGCAVPETGIAPPTGELYFPSGIAAHPDGRYLYVSNAVFDRRYNAGTLVVYDTHTRRIVDGHTREVGLFAGEMVFRPSGDSFDLVTVTRDDGRLYRFDLGADGALEPRDTASSNVATDPYGIAPSPDGTVMLTHLSRGIVSQWAVDDAGVWQKGCTVTLNGGASSIARHPTLGWAYVTDRLGNRMTMVEATGSVELVRGETTPGSDASKPTCELVVQGTLTVDPSEARGRSRGLAFSDDGRLLFVASSSDDSLRVYDVTVRAGRPRNTLLRAIPIGDAPDGVRVAGRPVDGFPADYGDACDVETLGEGLVYVTSFSDDRVVVLDPRSLSVIARIDTGSGPHDIAFMCDAGNRLRAYVTVFGEDALAVIDIDPRSNERFSLLATVKP